MALTPKQQAFVNEYLGPNLDGFCLSYIESGSAEEAAKDNGIAWLDNDHKYYVYLLVDSRCGSIFYVGKGTGTRAGAHVKAARRGEIDNAPKVRRILEILESGAEVRELKIFSTDDEREAYAVERELLISLSEYGLTNIVNGITTNEEKAHMQAKNLLAKIRPYTEWLNAITGTPIYDSVQKLGGHEKFYKEYVNRVESLVSCTEIGA